jgi:glycosyltransferase involved in cell wall biosynthesis
MPFFSICIPNYNYERYIGATLESVLNQDCQDFEIIVADNASTDKSVEIIKHYAKENGKIRLIQNRLNVGFAPNLERAARPATGQFMLMLSSDDVLLPGSLSVYKSIIDELGDAAKKTIIASSVAIIDSDGQSYDQRSIPSFYPLEKFDYEIEEWDIKRMNGTDMLTIALRWLNNPLPFASTMYSRELYEMVEGYNSTWTINPDFHFLLKLLRQNPEVIYVDKNLAGYRIHTANQGSQKSSQKSLKAEFDRYQMLLEYQKIADEFGVDPKDIEHILVNGVCLKKGAGYLSCGNWTFAFRLLCLACAFSPGVTFKSLRAYGLAGLLLLGPFGVYFAKFLKMLRGNTDLRPEFE